MLLFKEFESSFEGDRRPCLEEAGLTGRRFKRVLGNNSEQTSATAKDFLFSFNVECQAELSDEKLPEAILVLHLIADAIACLKDRWVTKQEKVDAFDWIFSPLTEDAGGLKYYADLIGANPTIIQMIATKFLVQDLHFANSLRFWW